MGAYIREGWESGGGGDGWSPVIDADLTTFADQDLTSLTQDAVSVVGDLSLYVDNLGVSGSADMVDGVGMVLSGLDDSARVAFEANDMIADWSAGDEYDCTFRIESFSMAGDGATGGLLLQAITAGDYAGTNCGGYLHDSTTSYRYGVNEDANRNEKGTSPGWTESAGPWVRLRIGPYGIVFYAGTTLEGMTQVGRASADLTNSRDNGAWSNGDAPRLFAFLPINCTTASMTISSVRIRHRPA